MNANNPQASDPPEDGTTGIRAALEDLQLRIAEALRGSGPAADVERNVRALLAQGFERLDLVSRDEIEQQLESIAALRNRIDALERQLDALSRVDPAPPAKG
ncbi:MAG: accessory factor UbiK family protein [Burkholderiaceae bacterium]|nr:accessory factor UbiK family protein [Burkholderiaceae bacterium]